jgi:hypothetical protein
MLLTALAIALQLQGPGLPADSLEGLRRDARRASANFERLSRRLIPIRYGPSGTNCDEIVGRFCLIYDSGRPYEGGPTHGSIIDARREAIEALRHVFTYAPGDFETAAPLVRYLVEDDRASEAAAAARLYRLESGDSVWGPLLVGFAEHATGSDTAAARHFVEGMDRLSPGEREDITDLEWVLEATDRRAWRRLDETGRSRLAHDFWVLSDPLYMTPGNESRNEHIARHIWARMLERAPRVADMLPWGRDLDQLTVRYGVPTARTRSPGTMQRDGSLTEHFDPDQLAWAPVDFSTRGPPPPPLPGRPWVAERTRSRSGYAPVTFRRMLPIEHQATRIPDGDSTIIRVDARFVMDSVATGAFLTQTAFYLLDRELRIVRQAEGTAIVAGDTARFHYEAKVPRDAYTFSLEAMEPGSRLAGRARYFLEDDSAAGPRISDPLILRSWSPEPVPADRSDPAFRPRASLIITPGDTLGLFARGSGFQPGADLDIQLALRPANRASLPARLFSWIGDKLGLSEPDSPTRLSWSDRAEMTGHITLAVELFPREEDKGDRVVILRVVDTSTGQAVESRRVIHIGMPATQH